MMAVRIGMPQFLAPSGVVLGEGGDRRPRLYGKEA